MKCPYCHSAVKEDQSVQCGRCKAFYHSECFPHKCSVYGCEGVAPGSFTPPNWNNIYRMGGRAAVMVVLAILAFVLISGITAGCAKKGDSPQRTALNDLNVARDAYIQAQQIVIELKTSGKISDEQWNNQIVPVDNMVNKGLDTAYGALRVYVASGDQVAFNEFTIALQEVWRLLAKFKSTAGVQ